MKKAVKVGSVYIWRSGHLIPLKRHFLKSHPTLKLKKASEKGNKQADTDEGKKAIGDEELVVNNDSNGKKMR